MLVVSDTTPIITLLKINRLEILQILFGKVLIPRAVFKELTKNEFYKNESETVKNSDFINVNEVENLQAVKILREVVGLDAGESESIALAEEINSDILLMDERKGRQVAKKLNLKIVGTVGILLHAYDENILSESDILECIEILKNSNIRISQNLLDLIVKHIEGGQKFR